jgi:predicted TIM-barrel fold metal-dependent hydrolase
VSIVIDIDSHFEPGDDWLQPYPELAARLPRLDPAQLAVHAIVGDLLRDVPAAERPSASELVPPGMATLFGQEKADEAERRRGVAEDVPEFEGKNQFQIANAQARVDWLDEQGIDLQNVICLQGVAYALFLDDRSLREDVLRTANTWLGETCAEAKGRLLPVAALDYEDLDFAVAELERMRRLGSRIFLIPAYPVAGVPPAHPSWDRVWEAAVSLGMTPMLHTGFERMNFDPGWANLGGDTTLMRMVCSAHRHVAPTTLLNALIYSGVFERFPTLTLLLAEVGTGWLPFMMREIDDRVSPISKLFLGDSNLPMKPSEYLARNVKATPLDGGNDHPILQIIEELPDEMIVFSSDFPHFEGFTDPIGHYRQTLAGWPEKRIDRFLGGTIADVYARMGDPIVFDRRSTRRV